MQNVPRRKTRVENSDVKGKWHAQKPLATVEQRLSLVLVTPPGAAAKNAAPEVRVPLPPSKPLKTQREKEKQDKSRPALALFLRKAETPEPRQSNGNRLPPTRLSLKAALGTANHGGPAWQAGTRVLSKSQVGSSELRELQWNGSRRRGSQKLPGWAESVNIDQGICAAARRSASNRT